MKNKVPVAFLSFAVWVPLVQAQIQPMPSMPYHQPPLPDRSVAPNPRPLTKNKPQSCLESLGPEWADMVEESKRLRTEVSEGHLTEKMAENVLQGRLKGLSEDQKTKRLQLLAMQAAADESQEVERKILKAARDGANRKLKPADEKELLKFFKHSGVSVDSAQLQKMLNELGSQAKTLEGFGMKVDANGGWNLQSMDLPKIQKSPAAANALSIFFPELKSTVLQASLSRERKTPIVIGDSFILPWPKDSKESSPPVLNAKQYAKELNVLHKIWVEAFEKYSRAAKTSTSKLYLYKNHKTGEGEEDVRTFAQVAVDAAWDEMQMSLESMKRDYGVGNEVINQYWMHMRALLDAEGEAAQDVAGSILVDQITLPLVVVGGAAGFAFRATRAGIFLIKGFAYGMAAATLYEIGYDPIMGGIEGTPRPEDEFCAAAERLFNNSSRNVLVSAIFSPLGVIPKKYLLWGGGLLTGTSFAVQVGGILKNKSQRDKASGEFSEHFREDMNRANKMNNEISDRLMDSVSGDDSKLSKEDREKLKETLDTLFKK